MTRFKKQLEILAAKGVKISELFINELTKDKKTSEASGNITRDDNFVSDCEGSADLEYAKRRTQVYLDNI